MPATPDLPSYPLRRRFLKYALPALVIGVAGLLYMVAQALSISVERLYEAQSVGTHKQLLASVSAAAPTAWRTAMTGDGADPDLGEVVADLQAEVDESNLECVSIRAANGLTIETHGTGPCRALSAEDLEMLNRVGATVFREDPGPPRMWTVATRVRDPATNRDLIVVSSQPAVAQERSIRWSTMLWVGALAGFLVAAIALACILVSRAQDEIDKRTTSLNEARRSLARFVSRHGQARAATGTTGARRLTATVLFVDVRDFSSYADHAPPEAAALLIEKVATIAFAAVLRHGGDVDRLLGDGLIAWFEGEDRKARAWRAATDVLRALASDPLARGVGLGLHDGEAVEAVIGVAGRTDATILGRSIIIAARLCGAAAGGEVIASEAMGPVPDDLRHGETETFSFKGQAQAVTAARYTLNAAGA